MDILTNYSEQYTFFKVLGDLSGQTSLDFACGNGYYTRLVIRLGARSVRMTADGELQDGTVVTVTVDTPGASLELRTRQWTQATFENVMAETQFHGVVWHPIEVSPQGIREYGESFWEDYQAKPRIAVFECWK